MNSPARISFVMLNGKMLVTLIARFMGPTWDPPGADRTQVGAMWATSDRTQVGAMWATWTLLSGMLYSAVQRWSPNRQMRHISIAARKVVRFTTNEFPKYFCPRRFTSVTLQKGLYSLSCTWCMVSYLKISHVPRTLEAVDGTTLDRTCFIGNFEFSHFD